jgi:hypothetical protein
MTFRLTAGLHRPHHLEQRGLTTLRRYQLKRLGVTLCHPIRLWTGLSSKTIRSSHGVDSLIFGCHDSQSDDTLVTGLADLCLSNDRGTNCKMPNDVQDHYTAPNTYASKHGTSSHVAASSTRCHIAQSRTQTENSNSTMPLSTKKSSVTASATPNAYRTSSSTAEQHNTRTPTLTPTQVVQVPGSKKSHWYVVIVGRHTGIFDDWWVIWTRLLSETY